MRGIKFKLYLLLSMILVSTSFAQLKIKAEFYGAKLGTVVDALAKLQHKNIMWDDDAAKEKNKKVFLSIQKPISVNLLFRNVLNEYNLLPLRRGNLINIKLSEEKIFQIPPEIPLYLGKESLDAVYAFVKDNLTPAGKAKLYPESSSIYVKDTKENIKKLEKLVENFVKPLQEKAQKIAKIQEEKLKQLEKEKELYSKLVKKEIEISQQDFEDIEDKLIQVLSPYGKYKYDPKKHKLVILEIRDNLPKISKVLAKLKKVNLKTKCFYVRSLEPNEILLNIQESYLSKYGSFTFKSKEMQKVSGVSQNNNANTNDNNTTININQNIITSLPKICITDLPSVIKKIKTDYAGILLDRPYQIVIEARIVQIQSSYIQDLGIQWGGSYATSSGNTVYSIGSGITGSNFIFDFPADNVSIGNGAAIGFSMVGLKGRLDLNLSALEQIGKTQILSRPKVITIDGEPAEISQGIEIPYQSSSAQYGTNVEFKKALLRLNVIPRTLPDGNIVMNITLSQDIPDFGKSVLGQPPINTKSITSRVVAKDGSTIVIGGILEKTDSTTTTGVPILHRIPLLGWLFKKRNINNESRELLIFISPKIVYE